MLQEPLLLPGLRHRCVELHAEDGHDRGTGPVHGRALPVARHQPHGRTEDVGVQQWLAAVMTAT
jgi:hypothetical protein